MIQLDDSESQLEALNGRIKQHLEGKDEVENSSISQVSLLNFYSVISK